MRRAFAIAITLAWLSSGHALEDVENPELTSKGRTILSLPANTPGPLIEETQETVFHWVADDNWLRYPDTFQIAANGWYTTNTLDPTLAATTSPYGGPVYLVAPTTAAGVGHSIRDPNGGVAGTASSNSFWTFSISVKIPPGSTARYLYLSTDGDNLPIFDLQTQTYTNGGDTTGVFSVTPEGNGWYRLRHSHYATTKIQAPMIGVTKSMGSFASTPDGTETFWVAAAQLVRGVTPAPYRAPVTANTLASPSAFDVVAVWTTSTGGTGALPTVTGNYAVAPDGTVTADRVQFNKGAGAGFSRIRQLTAASTPAGVVNTAGVWMKTNDGTTKTIVLRITASSSVDQRALVTVTPDWQSFVTSVASTGVGVVSLDVMLWDATPGPTSNTADLSLWGATLTRSDFQGDVPGMSGTVPLVTTSPMFARGSGAGRRLVGGNWSAANRFTLGTGSDVLDFTGDRTICFAFAPYPTASSLGLASDGAHLVDGWFVQLNSGVAFQYYENRLGSASFVNPLNTVQPYQINIGCVGRAGTAIYSKLNGGVTAINDPVPAPTPATTTPATIGTREGGSSTLNIGYLAEVWATSTPWDEASVTQIQANALASGGHGPYFPDDANTVLHLVGDGYDGFTWSSPQGVLNTLGMVAYSDGWGAPVAGKLQRQGFGPFNASNYYTLGAGWDVLDFTGDFSVCAVFSGMLNLTSNNVLVGARNAASTAGWVLYIASFTGVAQINTYGGATIGVPTVTAIGNGGTNVVCAGRNGANLGIKMNLGSYASGPATTPIVASGETTLLGILNGLAAPLTGTLHEVWASTEPASDALFTKIQQRVLQHASAHQQPLTVTRTSASMIEAPNSASRTIYTVPAGVAVQAADGTESWRAATNLNTRSEEIDAWVKQNTTVTPNVVIAPNGTTTADTVSDQTGVGLQHYVSQNVTLSAGLTYTISMYAKAGTGSPGAGLRFGLGSPSGYTSDCDLSTGTIAVGSGTNVLARSVSAVWGGWYRCSETFVAPTTGSIAIVAMMGNGGTYTGTNNTMHLWGVQVEQSPYVTPYISTSGTTAARTADQITIANPIPPYLPSWCLRFSARPGAGRSPYDGQAHTFLASGAYGSANSFSIEQDETGALTFEVYDATGNTRWITTTGFADSNAHDIAACVGNGTPTLTIDGAKASGAVGGTGSGILSAPQATISLGSIDGSSSWLDGAIRDVVICDRPTGACTPPAIPSTTLAYYPFDRSGSFEVDANTVSYVTWDGTPNLALNSEDLRTIAEGNTGSTWAASAGMAITANAAVAPNGTATADFIYKTDTSGSRSRMNQSITLTTGSTYTVSLYALADVTSSQLEFGLWCDTGFVVSTPTVVSGPATVVNRSNLASITNLSRTQWSRIALTGTVTGAGACVVYVYPDTAPSTTSGNGNFVWGVQVENALYAGQYHQTITGANALVDPYAVTTLWTMAGAVPQNIASPFYPEGFGDAQRKGAGPFSASNYYRTASAVDQWDFAGDFTLCVAYIPTATSAAFRELASDSDQSTTGWELRLWQGTLSPNAVMRGAGGGGAAVSITTSNAGDLNAPNVACMGVSGTTLSVKLNLGTTASGPLTSRPVSTGTGAGIGATHVGTSPATDISIVAVWATTTAWDETKVRRQIQRFLGLTSANGDVIGITRSSTVTNTMPDGRLWTWPSGVARVGCDAQDAVADCGMLTEGTRNNTLLQSASFDVVSVWTTPYVGVAPPTIVADTPDVLAPDGTQSAEKITFPAVGAEQVSLVSQTFTATAVAWSGSLYLRTLSGTATLPVMFYDYVAGPTSSQIQNCAVTTTWTRCGPAGKTLTGSATWTFRIGFDARVAAGNTMQNAAPFTVYAWGAQAEAGAFTTSYIPTVGTPAGRSIDYVSITNPFVAAPPAMWCVDSVITPNGGRGWSSAGTTNEFLWVSGTPGNANSAYGWIYAGGVDFTVRDGTNVDRNRFLAAPGWIAGTPHRMSFGWTDITSYIDGYPSGATISGTPHAGVGTWSPVINVGSNGGSFAWSGYTRQLRFCNSQCPTCR